MYQYHSSRHGYPGTQTFPQPVVNPDDQYPVNDASSLPHEGLTAPVSRLYNDERTHNTDDFLPQYDHFSTRYSGGLPNNNRESLLTGSYNPSYGYHTDRPFQIPLNTFYQGHSTQVDLTRPSIPSSSHLKRDNLIDTLSMPTTHPDSSLELNSALTGASSEHSGDSDFWPSIKQDVTTPEPSKPRKTRREKPRIELAPDQPPTTQGKPRARVYVACLQWYVVLHRIVLVLG